MIGRAIVTAVLAAAILVVVMGTVNRYYFGCSDVFRTCVVIEKPKI